MKCLQFTTPRTFLIILTGCVIAIASAFQDADDKPKKKEKVRMRVGNDVHFFDWIHEWGELPEGMKLGNTHGTVVVDKNERVYFNTDSENAIVVFESDGTFVQGWGKELAGGLHGMAIMEEEGGEFLYLTHTGRHEVLKATLDGKILWTLGYPKESGHYESADQYKPTGIAVRRDGEFYVTDGYGKGFIHHYDKDRKYKKSWGGPGTEEGKFRTPHGILVLENRGMILVADRENNRVQKFDLEGKFLALHDKQLRRPCNFSARGTDVAVADLAGRVTIFDKKFRFVTHIADNPDESLRANNGTPRDKWKDGEFIAPHGLCWTESGDMYVLDWLALGRVTKLRAKKAGR